MPTKKPRAIGIVRVSAVGGRSGETFVSPVQQAERIEAHCKREGLRLLETLEELDVSGRNPLEKRPGLSRAVATIEAGKADVLIVAYMDRLVRKEKIRLEVVERVERAGGEIYSLDHGALTNGNAAQKLRAGVIGAFNEYVASAAAERTAESRERAVMEGRPPFPTIPLGYLARREENDRVVGIDLDPATKDLVAEAFRLRADGASISTVRAFLKENGVERSFYAVQRMLASRFYLGELRHGSFVNPDSHEPLIDVATFNRVQKMVLPRGRRANSSHLLARLGVLRCASCDSRLSIASSTQNGKRYRFYRCSNQDCPRRVSIAAAEAERVVEEEVRRMLAGVKGRASAKSETAKLEKRLAEAQADLEAAVRVLIGSGMDKEQAAVEQLTALRQERDEAQERLDESRDTAATSLVVDGSADWDLFTMEERRALIKAVLARAVVAPGRGPNRISLSPTAAFLQ